ncbi:YihY/virulence factor BrkB family protein [Cellulomonas sp. DKR-3]|uniref:YihY/virulence factor BrkB family protein n=1 Tax=Cellulomonas fulva TaxID=2835530 RepID=A0ABS5TUG1_9CELL|nr:YihY/virulence factor BrkB family protein [Cellulomonas fulva]MBT0992779.1 YihY/virulence factor BrkB family protein [Cellulomonas fulva]
MDEREAGRTQAPEASAEVVEPAAGSGTAHRRAAAATGDPVGSHGPSLVDRAKAALAWWQRTRPARANARFGARGGGVLTGGIAYATLFSVFAALTFAWTVFMAVLGGNKELRQQVLDAIDEALPGLVDNGSNDGVISPDDLQLSAGLTVAGIIAVVVLLLSALAATGALRTGVRAMFADEAGGGDNAVLGKLRQLAGLAGFAFAILLSVLLTTGATAAAQWVLQGLDWGGVATVAVQAVGILVALVVDLGVFVLVVRVLAGESPPTRDLLWGALIAAVGIGVVRYLGTSVVAGSISKNPALAPFAVIVTLLLWVNLIARIMLLASAWVANPPQDAPDEA